MLRNARQAQRGEGQQIVQGELPHIGKPAALQILQYAVGQARQQAGADAKRCGEQHQGQHGAGRHGAALGHPVQADAGKHKGQGNGQRAEGHRFRRPFFRGLANRQQDHAQRHQHAHGDPHRARRFAELGYQVFRPGGVGLRNDFFRCFRCFLGQRGGNE